MSESKRNVLNASGHADALPRQYNLREICSTALVIDNAWVVFGGSAVVSLSNGGAPGLLYELLVACGYYLILSLCIAELASAIPSSGGVYHWASATAGPRYGRIVGFFAGHLSYWGWLVGWAPLVLIPADVLVQMYALYHPEYILQPWHTYLAYLVLVWITTAAMIWGNKWMPAVQTLGVWIVVLGGLATVLVLAVMPEKHASNSFVWKNFTNITGWPNSVALLAGVLNGSLAIGTPDGVTHMAEELPRPRRDLPLAIGAQLLIGGTTSFVYAVALMYAITDLNAVVAAPGSFPLATIYVQATGSRSATFGLLFIVFLCLTFCVIGSGISIGRNLWALARDDAVPFAALLASCDERLGCTAPAYIVNAVLASALGVITLGSRLAFNDLAGSFTILTTSSFFLFIFPNALTRGRYLTPGPFTLGQRFGPFVHGLAAILIIFFNVIFCLPYRLPVSGESMNYNCVILPGVLFITAMWWGVAARKQYRGPCLLWDNSSSNSYENFEAKPDSDI